MTITSKHQTESTVRKTIQVNVPKEHAFAVFTNHLNDWWPLRTHFIGAQPAQTAIIEPHVGGRWFERANDGSECDWGRVLVWEPPDRIVLSWDITADWKYDPKLGTEVEVRFISESPGITRVELEHRHLDRYGPQAETMRAIFDTGGSGDVQGGWAGLLQLFALACHNV
jgi:uncharacterized protein YndB with AHSA1/START domain